MEWSASSPKKELKLQSERMELDQPVNGLKYVRPGAREPSDGGYAPDGPPLDPLTVRAGRTCQGHISEKSF